ncbi:hypothetical protein BKA56DRAFT_663730 [Ilyonectria sp. MPI-CAGE-AT-0026]|nr:hypothetical protein BKA56DRAFT_663730 [Ilyonectria sp. MPI-CAGE-AT-0026]
MFPLQAWTTFYHLVPTQRLEITGEDDQLMASFRSGLDILRTGIESIDSFDAKSYEYRIEFLGIRFDVESTTGLFDSHRIECSGSHSTFDYLESNVAYLIQHTNRTAPTVRSKIDRFGRTSDAVRWNPPGARVSVITLTRQPAPGATWRDRG